jgi:hypothetical protein
MPFQASNRPTAHKGRAHSAINNIAFVAQATAAHAFNQRWPKAGKTDTAAALVSIYWALGGGSARSTEQAKPACEGLNQADPRNRFGLNELSGGIFGPNVFGNISQVISKLMTAAVDGTNSCLREPRAMERKVGKRHNIIVAAVIKKDERNSLSKVKLGHGDTAQGQRRRVVAQGRPAS